MLIYLNGGLRFFYPALPKKTKRQPEPQAAFPSPARLKTAGQIKKKNKFIFLQLWYCLSEPGSQHSVL